MDTSKTVLCVEDNQDSRELLECLLGLEGFQTVSCSTSEEGLELAKQGGLSAIILDHQLAYISGVEICRQIRNYDQQTPIIFYTAAAHPTDRETGLEAGANAYLVKPNDFDRITDTIKQLVL